MTQSETTSRSPLEQWHRDAGAKMTEFHGWTMPLHYTRVSAEVQATRRHVGLFDLCHMGRIQIRGVDRIPFAEHLFTNSIADMEDGRIAYGFLCNDSGGVIDDVTVYRHQDYLMFVVNAANREDVMAWFRRHGAEFDDAQIEDETANIAMIAVQGPSAIQVVEQLCGRSLADLKYYAFRSADLSGHTCLLSRTGYTGEDGFEIYCGRAFAETIWKAALDAALPLGGAPVGLAARDTLRLEAGFPLHGQELTPQTSPIEARLERFVAFEKRRFIGRSALLATTASDVALRLVGFAMVGRVIPRTGQPICQGEIECGLVTSGGFSPTLGKPIGMGYVEQQLAQEGHLLQILIRGQHHPAVVVRRPFHRSEKRT
jgi:aminomethyltransferase